MGAYANFEADIGGDPNMARELLLRALKWDRSSEIGMQNRWVWVWVWVCGMQNRWVWVWVWVWVYGCGRRHSSGTGALRSCRTGGCGCGCVGVGVGAQVGQELRSACRTGVGVGS